MRKMSILVLLGLLLTLAGSALAQDAIPVFCGTLAEADCTLLNESQTAMQGLTSASANFDMTLSISGIPDMPGPMDFSLTGTGAFIVTDPSAVEAMAGMSPEQMADPAAIGEALGTLLKVFSGDLNMTLTIPESLAAMGGGIPTDIPLQVRMVNGVGYLNFDTLAPLNTSGSDMPTGWQGIDVAGALPMLMQQASMMSGGATAVNPAAANPSAFGDPELMSKFTTIQRLPDSTDASGQPLAVFQTTVDLGAFFSDPQIQQMMMEQAQAQAGADADQQQMAMAMQMLPMLFQDFAVTSTQSIGLNDKYVHSSSASFNWTLDPQMIAAMAGESGGDTAEMQPINISFSFNSTAGDFNAVAPIAAPEGATVVPLEQLMGGGSAQ